MPSADLVLKNANVITMDPAQPKAGGVGIRGDKFRLVAGNKDLESAIGPKTRVIDCRGKTIVPGFNDAHCHIFSFIRSLLSIDLGLTSVTSIADVKEAIRRQAANTPPGTWISATGLNEFYLTEKRLPTRHDLDEVAPQHPVVVSHRSLHACVLNSLALALAGITIATPDPAGGLIDRELGTGEPNGILYEMLGYIREKVMPPITAEDMARATALADRQYLSCGITSLQDTSASNDFGRWIALRELKKAGKLQSRIGMMLSNQAVGEFRKAGFISGSGDSHLRLGAVKTLLTETTGRLQPPQPELNEMALNIHRGGFQLAFHAVAPGTVEAAIATLEYVNSKSSIAGRRHRVEHCAECSPPLLERLSRLGAVVVTQPPFLYYSGERYLATIPPERLPWLYRFKSLLESGLTVAASSDSPVVPNNPMVGLYAAVVREAASGQALLPQERIAPLQALAMYTTNGAYASFEDNAKGTISPGKLADLAVLSDDPTQVALERIRDIRVEMTIIGGRIVWEA